MRADLQQLLAEPAPCDGCPRAPACSAQQLACSAFALYLAGYRESRWRIAARVDATHERFLELDGRPLAPPRRNRTSRKPRDDGGLPLEWLAELTAGRE